MQLDDDEEGKGGETRLNRRDSAARVKYRDNVMSKTRVMYMIEKSLVTKVINDTLFPRIIYEIEFLNYVSRKPNRTSPSNNATHAPNREMQMHLLAIPKI